MSGLKYDQEKPRMDLLDPLAIEGLAKVLTFGANKYAAHNWRGGLSYSRLIAALLRHTFAILRGERNDPESGLPHVDHLGCCWMFLSNQMKTREDMDDLYKSDMGSGPVPTTKPVELPGAEKWIPIEWKQLFPSDTYYMGTFREWEQWKKAKQNGL